MTKYTDLITSEHAKRPKFVATVELSTNPSIEQRVAIEELPSKYDLDLAVGVQLDAVGLWIGASRNVLVPLENVFFSFDTPGLGWNEGYWKGPFDPTQGLVSLPDDVYRSLLYATVSLNSWDGRLASAVAAIEPLFPGNRVFIQDNQDMTMTVVVSGPPPDVVKAALLTGGYLALKPVGVAINYLFPTEPTGPVFGLDADNEYIGGLDVGSWGSSSPYTP